jgi:hypothetical protein
MARDQMTISISRRSHIRRKTHRLVASKHPTIGVFDDLASDASDLRAAFILEALTNDRLVAQRIGLLPDTEIVAGPVGSGATMVMAAFLHADPAGGRFTDGRLGGWYALELETAIAETLYHNSRRLRLSASGFPNRIQIRQLIASVRTDLVDLRGLRRDRPDLYRDTDYSASQAFAAELRWPRSGTPENGIVFDSVRCERGTNICMFWPSKVPLPIIQGDHFEYFWDASGQPSVMKLTNVAI